MADDLVEERLAQIDFALPETRLIGALWVTLELAAVGYRRTHICFAVLILVDQLDMSSKRAASSGCGGGFAFRRRCCKHRERTTQKQLAASRPYGLGRDPG